jgi:exopolysaccharide biosynthesis WecB/TagA/CpsF family protein
MDGLSETFSLFGLPISRLGLDEAVSRCRARAESAQGGYACFVNVHTTTESRYHPGLRAALIDATFDFADGLPLVWVSRLSRDPVRSRVCGPDFMADFLRATVDWTHGFLGGRPDQGQAIARRFGVPYRAYSPPMRAFSPENAREDWQRFLDGCPDGVAPRVVWVGLGAPKQELWMQAVSELAPGVFFFGVGAAFDFLSSAKRRAPRWMQKAGLEWLFRLSQEPGRLWKRYFKTNALFLGFLLLDRIRPSRSPGPPGL